MSLLLHIYVCFCCFFFSQVRASEYSLLRFSCGGLITSTSQASTLPLWSSESFRASLQSLNNEFFNSSIVEDIPYLEIWHYVSSSNPKVITLYEAGNYRSLSTDICRVEFEPSFPRNEKVFPKVGQIIIDTVNDTNDCGVSFSGANNLTTWTLRNLTFGVGMTTEVFSIQRENLPLTISFRPPCALRMMLIINQWGNLNELVVWLPPLLFTIVSFVLLAYALLDNNFFSFPFFCGTIFWLFCCFVYSCTGLTIELLLWKTNAAIILPFPSSVLLFLLCAILYAFLLCCFALSVEKNSVVLLCALRLLTFGICISVAIASFYSGFIIVAILCSFQILLGNAVLALHYSFSIFSLYHNSGLHLFSLHGGYVWRSVWFPLTSVLGPSILFCISVLKNELINSEKKLVKLNKKRITTFLLLQSSFLFFLFYPLLIITLLSYLCFIHATFLILLSFTLAVILAYVAFLLQLAFRYYRQSSTKKNIFFFFFGADIPSLFLFSDENNIFYARKNPFHENKTFHYHHYHESSCTGDAPTLKKNTAVVEYWPTTVGLDYD